MTFRQGFDWWYFCVSLRLHRYPALSLFMGYIRLVTESKTRGVGGGLITLGITVLRSSASVCNDSVTVSRGDRYQDNAENEAGKWDSDLIHFLRFLHLLWHVRMSLVANRPEIMCFFVLTKTNVRWGKNTAWGKEKKKERVQADVGCCCSGWFSSFIRPDSSSWRQPLRFTLISSSICSTYTTEIHFTTRIIYFTLYSTFQQMLSSFWAVVCVVAVTLK